MSEKLSGLKPTNVWHYFEEISSYPRESGNEKAAVDYLENLAKRKGLEYRRDELGNIVIVIPASPGYEKAPKLVLQGHIDMVCVKSADCQHDFSREGLELVIDGDWLRAKNTTLGADNAIGLAAALALIDETELIHPELEILSTVDEETGMTGAIGLSPDMLKGRILLNLDSEDIDVLYVGCAGGIDSVIKMETPREEVSEGTAFKLAVSGLVGGHSGLDIHKHRANAIKLLARILFIMDKKAKIASINGGVRRNVIPSNAEAVIVVKESNLAKLKKAVKTVEKQSKEEYGRTETNLKIGFEELAEKPKSVIKKKEARRIVGLLNAVPFGILAMSTEMKELVETSNNIGVLRDHGDHVEIVSSTRSSSDGAKARMQDEIAAAVALADGELSHEHEYPGWKPNLKSKILQTAIQTYNDVFSKEPKVIAIHAGLEAGLFSQKFTGMDMISFGPEIEGAHSVNERVHIKSVAEFYSFLKALVERVAKQGK